MLPELDRSIADFVFAMLRSWPQPELRLEARFGRVMSHRTRLGPGNGLIVSSEAVLVSRRDAGFSSSVSEESWRALKKSLDQRSAVQGSKLVAMMLRERKDTWFGSGATRARITERQGSDLKVVEESVKGVIDVVMPKQKFEIRIGARLDALLKSRPTGTPSSRGAGSRKEWSYVWASLWRIELCRTDYSGCDPVWEVALVLHDPRGLRTELSRAVERQPNALVSYASSLLNNARMVARLLSS